MSFDTLPDVLLQDIMGILSFEALPALLISHRRVNQLCDTLIWKKCLARFGEARFSFIAGRFWELFESIPLTVDMNNIRRIFKGLLKPPTPEITRNLYIAYCSEGTEERKKRMLEIAIDCFAAMDKCWKAWSSYGSSRTGKGVFFISLPFKTAVLEGRFDAANGPSLYIAMVASDDYHVPGVTIHEKAIGGDPVSQEYWVNPLFLMTFPGSIKTLSQGAGDTWYTSESRVPLLPATWWPIGVLGLPSVSTILTE